MKAIVKLFGGLKSCKDFNKNDEGDIIFEFSDSVTMTQLIELLELNKKPFIVILNGIILHNFSNKIRDGDEISLFPPIAGGNDFHPIFLNFNLRELLTTETELRDMATEASIGFRSGPPKM